MGLATFLRDELDTDVSVDTAEGSASLRPGGARREDDESVTLLALLLSSLTRGEEAGNASFSLGFLELELVADEAAEDSSAARGVPAGRASLRAGGTLRDDEEALLAEELLAAAAAEGFLGEPPAAGNASLSAAMGGLPERLLLEAVLGADGIGSLSPRPNVLSLGTGGLSLFSALLLDSEPL